MNSHRVAAAAVALIAAAFFAATFWFEQMPEGITRGFGAEAFPRLVLGTIIVLAIILALASPVDEALPRIPATVYYTGASMLVFMALVPVSGMLAAMFLFSAGLGWLWGERRYRILLASSLLLSTAIWLVFAKGFRVPLPAGLF